MLLGAQRRFEVTGEATFAALNDHFARLVLDSRTYATGASTHNELWDPPGQLGHTLKSGGARFDHGETCVTHNMVRLVSKLLRASGGAVQHAEYIERALFNGVLGSQRGIEPGSMLYFFPLGNGVSKRAPQSWRHSGWSTAHGDYWCCQGTGIEAFARLPEHIFLQSSPADAVTADSGHLLTVDTLLPKGGGGGGGGATPELLVVQLISSTLRWRRAGLQLELRVSGVGASHPSQPAAVELRVVGHEDPGNGRAAIALRVPSWAEAPTATLNGGAVGERAVPGSYLRVERAWRTGDSLALSLPTRLRTEPLPDSRPMYSSMVALLHGPLVLACVGCRATAVAADATALLSHLTPIEPGANRRLRTLRRVVARGAAAGAVVAAGGRLWVREGELPASPFRAARRGGTDLSGAVTFSVSAGLAPGDNLVSFEAFLRPGCYVSAPASKEQSQLELVCVAAGSEPTAAQAQAASFRRHDAVGLTSAHGNFFSYESVARPGFFVSTYGAAAAAEAVPQSGGGGFSVVDGAAELTAGGSPGSGGAPPTLKPLSLKEKKTVDGGALKAFGYESVFEEGRPEAEHPPAAWALRTAAGGMGGGIASSALVYPLNELVDETYSVYWGAAPSKAGGGVVQRLGSV